jgi:hypothetical protein
LLLIFFSFFWYPRFTVEETRIIFGLDDIKLIRITCISKDCRGATLFKLDSVNSTPNKCPYCHARWTVGGEPILAFRFVHWLRRLHRHEDDWVEVKIEIDADSA